MRNSCGFIGKLDGFTAANSLPLVLIWWGTRSLALIIAILRLLWHNIVRFLLCRDCQTVSVVQRVTPVERRQRLSTSLIGSRLWLISRNLGSLLLLTSCYLLFALQDHLLLFQELDWFGESLFRKPFCRVRMPLLEENLNYVGRQDLWRSWLHDSASLTELL